MICWKIIVKFESGVHTTYNVVASTVEKAIGLLRSSEFGLRPGDQIKSVEQICTVDLVENPNP